MSILLPLSLQDAHCLSFLPMENQVQAAKLTETKVNQVACHADMSIDRSLPPELIERSVRILSGEDMSQVAGVSRAWRKIAGQGAVLAFDEAIYSLESVLHQITGCSMAMLFAEHGMQMPRMDLLDCRGLQDVQKRICGITDAIMRLFLALDDNQFAKLRALYTVNTIFGFEKIFEFIEDKKKVLKRIQEGNLNFDARWRNDREVILAAVRQDGRMLVLSDVLQDDLEIVLAAVQQNVWLFPYASDRLKDNRGLAMVVVGLDGLMLRYASESLRDDEEVVGAAMQQNDSALQYASLRLQQHFGVV
jgi:hypothetical protein